MKLLFLDTETTGLTEHDRLCQVAFNIRGEDEVRCSLFRPEVDISMDATLVSHITNEMVADCKPFKESQMYKDLTHLLKDHILVAHNAEFDIRMLSYEGIKVPQHICTKKVAQALGGPARFNLQYLRYFLKLPTTGIAHTADGDVRVLRALFERLSEEMSIEDMLKV